MASRIAALTAATLIAPFCLHAQTKDPNEVLKSALTKLQGTGHSLMHYTCLQTIERFYYSVPSGNGGAAQSCSGRAFSKDRDLTLDSDDRLRLQVAVVDGNEISSWAAATRFDSRAIWDLVSTGAISSGAFGGALIDIFENSGTQYTFIGSSDDGSRKLLEFSFEVPLMASNWFIRADNRRAVTAYRGRFAIDKSTAELVRLSSETDELTPDTRLCRIRTANDYHHLQIGDGRYLVPSRAELDTVTPTGSETRNITTFSSCHEYSAESTVNFGGAVAASEANSAPKSEAVALPAGLSLTLALTSPIDTNTAAAGDAISARVTRAVRAPKSNVILIAAGAIAHGRILNLEHLYSPRYLPSLIQYSVLFESLEQNGAVSPLSLELERDPKREPTQPSPPTSGERGSWFAIPGAKSGAIIPAGTESKWRTGKPSPQF